jgi:apolipoprotein N-acyltransferase
MGREVVDPYEQPDSFLRRHRTWMAALAVFVLTTALTVLSFPPYHTPEFAYAFAVPAIFWAYFRPPLRLYAGSLVAAQAVSWGILLFWLHNVTWAGPLLLAPVVGSWVGLWYLAAWWTMPRMVGKATLTRITGMLGLAGAWVILEWTRTWFLGGFAWLPLGASQWQRPGILQIAAFTGEGGVSFVLIAVNVGFAAYMHRLLCEGPVADRRLGRSLSPLAEPSYSLQPADWGFSRRSQEFLFALFLLLSCLCVYMVQVQPFDRPRFARPFARVAFVQPYIPQTLKWDPNDAVGIVRVLDERTAEAAAAAPDLILWPEASAPAAVRGDPAMQAHVEALSTRAQVPILLGSIAIERQGESERWFNSAMLVTPDHGLMPGYYSKQRLVPFGEYVPFRPLLGWLSKFVPIGPDDFSAGTGAVPLVVGLPHGPAAFGPLVCYEDTFPQLARMNALAGSDALVVLTNDAWYGEGGEAYQHAAHSVLRAVETRRPVLRCGNGGWSGWIDEFGVSRYVLTDDDGSVYFRGVGVVNVTRDERWIGRDSFYVEHGDWFVGFAAILGLLGFATLRRAE